MDPNKEEEMRMGIESDGSGGFQNLNSIKSGRSSEGLFRVPGLEHGQQDGGCLAAPGTGERSESAVGGPAVQIKEAAKSPWVSKTNVSGTTKWSSLFGVKPSGKSSFPPIKTIQDSVKGSCAIAIPDEIVDHNIQAMASSLVGKFLGPRLSIDDVRKFIKQKWALKGQVSVTAMAKGFMSFDFTCLEDLASILSEGQWAMGRSSLVLQKWSLGMSLNDSFFFPSSCVG